MLTFVRRLSHFQHCFPETTFLIYVRETHYFNEIFTKIAIQNFNQNTMLSEPKVIKRMESNSQA